MSNTEISARPAGFFTDLATVARRAIRSLPREPEAIIPAIIVPVFFFFVNVGSLQKLAQSSGSVVDFKAFQLPVAIIFAVTGVSRASALVTDIQDGYFDRLLVTPVKRPALLLGLMIADFVLVVVLSIGVTALAMVMGVRFVTGPLGMLAFLLIGIAIGPSGLGRLAGTFPMLGYLTIDDPAGAAPFAELGVMFLLFLIGLDLSFERLKALQLEIHDTFIDLVKERRGAKLKDDADLFTGLFWSGVKGLELGLVEHVRLRIAVGTARRVAAELGEHPHRVVQQSQAVCGP